MKKENEAKDKLPSFDIATAKGAFFAVETNGIDVNWVVESAGSSAGKYFTVIVDGENYRLELLKEK